MKKLIEITIKLLSDTILSSGHSQPGGDDITNNIDEQGYPYLKGSTFKGLLRENLINLFDWTGNAKYNPIPLLGEEGFGADTGLHRISISSFTLPKGSLKPADTYFASRTFTSLENGIVKKGSLRSAQCIKGNNIFKGEIECHSDDVTVITDAICAIKWIGTMRNRGFGQVAISTSVKDIVSPEYKLPKTHCIHYRFKSITPVIMTNLSQSLDNAYETKGYISGSSIRGMVINNLALNNPEIFEKYKTSLLTDQTKFLDAFPNNTDLPVIPAIRGFYSAKNSNELEAIFINGEFTEGKKRANLGAFCAIDKEKVKCWFAPIGENLRIQRAVKEGIFSTRHINSGTEFEGYIFVENQELAQYIAQVFTSNIWIGADRHSGYGKSEIISVNAVDAPLWSNYGYTNKDKVSKTLYMFLISPLAMQNEYGESCSINENELAKELGVSNVKITISATATAEYAGYNRHHKSFSPAIVMYDRGSVFKIECSEVPKISDIHKLQIKGLGIRKAEGFGQVLFIKNDILEKITHKENLSSAKRQDDTISNIAKKRSKRLSFIMDKANLLQDVSLSNSQLGDIQRILDESTWDDFTKHLDYNINNRGAKHGDKFGQMKNFIDEHFDAHNDLTFSEKSKAELLSEVINFGRKINGGADNESNL